MEMEELSNDSENRSVCGSECNQPQSELRSEETQLPFQSEQQQTLEVSSCKSKEDQTTETRGKKRHLSDNSNCNSESSSKEREIKKEKRVRHSSSTSSSGQAQSVQLLSGNPSCSVRSGENGLQGVVLSISENSKIENLLKAVQTETASSTISSVVSSAPVSTVAGGGSAMIPSTANPPLRLNAGVMQQNMAQMRSKWRSNFSVSSFNSVATINTTSGDNCNTINRTSSTLPSVSPSNSTSGDHCSAVSRIPITLPFVSPCNTTSGGAWSTISRIQSTLPSVSPSNTTSGGPCNTASRTSATLPTVPPSNTTSGHHCNTGSRTPSILPSVSPSNTASGDSCSTVSRTPSTLPPVSPSNTVSGDSCSIVSRTPSTLPPVSPSRVSVEVDTSKSDSATCNPMQGQNRISNSVICDEMQGQRGAQGLGGAYLQVVPSTRTGSNTNSAATGTDLPQLPDAPLQSQTLWSQLSKERQAKVIEARKKCFAWWRQYAHLMRKEDAEEALEHILNVRLSSFRRIYTRYSRLISQCITECQSGQSCQQVPSSRQSSSCTGNSHSQWLATEQQQRSVSSQENRVPARNLQGVQQHIPGGSEAVSNPAPQHSPNHGRLPLPYQQPSAQPNQRQFTHYNIQPGVRNQESLPPQPQPQWHQVQNQLSSQQPQQATCQQTAESSSANRQVPYAMYGQQHAPQIYRQTFASQQMQSGQGSSHVHSVSQRSMPGSGPMLSPRGSTNMYQGQQNVNNARMQPSSYHSHVQQRPSHPGCNLPRQPSSISSGYSTVSQSSGVSSGVHLPSHPHNISFTARNSTASNNRFPSYIESRRLPGMFPRQQTELSRLLSTTQPIANYSVPNQGTSLSNVSVQSGQYLSSTAQRVQYPPNESVTMNRHHQTGANRPSVTQRPSVMMSNQNRIVNPVGLRAFAPGNNLSSIPRRPPINEVISRVQSSSGTLPCTASMSTPLFINTGIISNASTSNVSPCSNFAELVRAATEDISPPIVNTGIAGCPTDVQPIVIAPVDDIPPTPAAADSCETEQSADQDGEGITKNTGKVNTAIESV